MPPRIFINNLDTFVSKALLSELKKSLVGEDGEAQEAPFIYGTYIDKDSSVKPEVGIPIKKMLKVSCACNRNSDIEIKASPCHAVPLKVRPYYLRSS